VGLPMMLILSSIKVKDKYLYDVNAIENNDKKATNIKKLIDKKKSFFNTNDSKFNKLFNKTISSAKCEVRTDLKNYNTADILIVSINFETKKNIKDFNILKDLIRNIGSRIKKKTLILFETTIPPGTCEKILIPELEKSLLHRKIKLNEVSFSYSFERVMPRKNYLSSITSNYRCYSGYNNLSKHTCKKFLNSFINIKKYPLYELNTITKCEAAKILENSYRAINIAFIDEWTKYSSLMKINLMNIIQSIKMRPTHSNIMRPGLGVGGYCLTKNPLFVDI
jgi:UDP-N-acetyl-D-glucosamine dehydrogenase